MTAHGISQVRGKRFPYDGGTHIPFIIRHATLSLPSNDPDESPFVRHLEGFSGSTGEVVDFQLTQAGLIGPDADFLATPHDDGVPNLLKFAFNLDLHGGRR